MSGHRLSEGCWCKWRGGTIDAECSCNMSLDVTYGGKGFKDFIVLIPTAKS